MSYPQSTSRAPILAWLERNALDPKKITSASIEAGRPRAEIRLSIEPDTELQDWVASLGFDLRDVRHVDVAPSELKVTKIVRGADGAALLEGIGLDMRHVLEVVTIDLTA